MWREGYNQCRHVVLVIVLLIISLIITVQVSSVFTMNLVASDRSHIQTNDNSTKENSLLQMLTLSPSPSPSLSFSSSSAPLPPSPLSHSQSTSLPASILSTALSLPPVPLNQSQSTRIKPSLFGHESHFTSAQMLKSLAPCGDESYINYRTPPPSAGGCLGPKSVGSRSLQGG